MADQKEKTKMIYRYLGKTGLKVSVLSLGAWVNWGGVITDDEAFACMKAAYDAGCNFFDNAEVYAAGKAEETMGRCIERLAVDRSELVISTKIYWGGSGVNQRGLSRKHVIEGTQACLKRLKLDYVDVVFAHRPDPETPMEEIVRAFDHVVNRGWSFYWGTSEWSAAQIAEAQGIAARLGLIPPVCEQPQYSMLHRTRVEAEYAPLYTSAYGLGTTIWSPLASGLLTGKYTKDVERMPEGSRLSLDRFKWLKDQFLAGSGDFEEKNFEAVIDKAVALQAVAEELGCSLPQLALAWCARNPNVSTVLTGASRASQVVENFEALQVIPKLTDEVLAKIEAIIKNKPKQPRNFKA